MKLRREYIISYDIEDTPNRTRVFKEFQKYGLRPIQKSVFWGYLTLSEARSLHIFLKDHCDRKDKGLIAKVSIEEDESCYLVGHDREEFRDWRDSFVI